jgi:hypothetical protein
VIRHLPHNIPAEDISEGLVSLGFNVVSFKQMTATRRSPPEEYKIINLPLFLVTLLRTAKSQEIFRLPSLCHIAIRVETYRAQNALTQCYNCQQFGHVWANCKHLHKDYPEKGNAASTPTCCNCQLAERDIALIPPITAAADMRRSSYRSGSHREHPRLQRKGVLLKSHDHRCLVRGGAPSQHTAATTTSGTPSSSGRKGGTAFAVRKDIPHNHVDLPPLVSVEATGVCIHIGNSEVLPAAVYKSSGRA